MSYLMQMFKKNDSAPTISNKLEKAITDLEELTTIHGHNKIVVSLIEMTVNQTVEYPNQIEPLGDYSQEEQDFIKDVFETLMDEIKEKILVAKKRKEAARLPEIELNYKYPVEYEERLKFTNSYSTYRILLNNWSEQIEFREEFNILLVDNALNMLGLFNIGKGGNTFTPVDIKLIFAAALKANATGIILAHNHPSGKLFPSAPDLKVTKEIEKAAKLLNISILDHLIVTPSDYFSFADEGLMGIEIDETED